MAKDEEKKEEVDKDSFSDEDEKATTSAETVASKRGSSAPPKAPEPDDAGGSSDEDEGNADDEDESDSDDAGDEEPEAKAPAAAKPARSTPPTAGIQHAAPAHGPDEHHGFAHVVSVQLLGGVLAALLVLTIVTVAVTKIDLGGEWNLVVAMVIATVKAGLVVTFFMHLLWDKKFNLLVFMSGVLFVILFIAIALTDRKEYQPLIDQREAAQAQQAQ